MDKQRASLSVAIVPLPNFTLIAFASFVDVLRLAGDEGDRSRPRACRWTVMAPGRRMLRASCGVELVPSEACAAPERFDYVVVAGGLLPPAERAMLDAERLAFLRSAHAAGVGLIGICTGSLALAEAGLLGPGQSCCVSWYHLSDLEARFPRARPVADRLWVRDGRVITCAGGVASADLAASLVQERLGRSAAQKSLHIMQIEGQRPASSAQPQPPNTVRVGDARVRRAMLLMEQNLAAPLAAETLARRLAVSRRQLERLFQRELGTGMQAFGRDLRLSYAIWLLAQPGTRIGDVAAQCGFADAAHFSRVFRATFGRAPSSVLREGPSALHDLLDRWWPYGARDTTSTPRANGPAAADRRPYL